jgi:hypothetical protein
MSPRFLIVYLGIKLPSLENKCLPMKLGSLSNRTSLVIEVRVVSAVGMKRRSSANAATSSEMASLSNRALLVKEKLGYEQEA